jgi:hypothetical protein
MPPNDKIETIIFRDFRMAYGMQYEIDFLHKFTKLRTFIVEINDLRGSDRHMYPKIIVELTSSISNLLNLECVEIGQKSGHTSCTFEDSDIEHE